MILINSDSVSRRCSSCRYERLDTLPSPDKKVIYLDQFVFSQLFKVHSGGSLGEHRQFWIEMEARVRRTVLLQQAIFPASNIHFSETTVSPFSEGLRAALESYGGDDASFLNSDDIKRAQSLQCFKAYRASQNTPTYDLNVDHALSGKRNSWLSLMRVHVKANFSLFADNIRQNMNISGDSMERIFKEWALKKPTFAEALKVELESYGSSRAQILGQRLNEHDVALKSGDVMAALDASGHPVVREFMELTRQLQAEGMSEDAAAGEVLRFWTWPGNWTQPALVISAHLFAQLARKVAAGQRKVTRGLINDVTAISVYGPYVDAMFVDRECAALIKEVFRKNDIPLRARVFSLRDKDDFLAYLENLEASAPPEVKEMATHLYRVEQGHRVER